MRRTGQRVIRGAAAATWLGARRPQDDSGTAPFSPSPSPSCRSSVPPEFRTGPSIRRDPGITATRPLVVRLAPDRQYSPGRPGGGTVAVDEVVPELDDVPGRV